MFQVLSDLLEIDSASKGLLSQLKGLNLPNDFLEDIRLSFEEALINAIKHGNKFNKKLKVEYSLVVQDNSIIIRVKDQGQGYDYNKIPNPTLINNFKKRSGRGVFLIKKLMDKVGFNEKGNEIIMEKFIGVKPHGGHATLGGRT